ncbi:MAG: hypothetical protein CMF22_07585 [Idiomarinaceae bacterium]|nr:hypothetical protein [Idiomarinaceae bacterium]|tara:strand:- start:162 stop:674 length:513 start_codon:yes stop_codon:yes gene_type:complete
MKSALNLPLSAKLALLVFTLFCVWDFTQRVWVTADSTTRNATAFDPSAYTLSANEMSPAITEWLAAREAQRQAAAEPDEEANKTPAIPLLEGGTNLGNMRVRVRAIYTATDSQTRLALLDIQSIEQRSVEIIEAEEGFTVDSYQLEAIDVNTVAFRSAVGEVLTIPVFDY